MTDDIAKRARALGLDSVPRDRRGPHYVGLRLPDGPPASVLHALARRKVFVSVRGSSIRVTPHVYN